MNKKIYLLIIPAILVAGFYLWPQKTTTEVTSEIPETKITPNKKLFLGRRQKLHATKNSALAPACQSLREQLSTLDLNLPLKELVKSLSLEDFNNCPEPTAQERIKELQKYCFDKFVSHECEANLLFVRAILRTFNVNEGYDLETMADLVLREFSKKVPDFKKLVLLSDQLLQMNPSNQAFQKMWAMSKLISQDNMRKLPEGFAQEIYGRLDPEVYNDPELRGYRLFVETQLEPLKTEAFARDYVKEHPTRAESYEILGWSLWQQNRRAEALASLEHAMSLSPKDQWLRDVYAKLKAPGAGPGDYPGRLNLGIRFEDILQ